MAAYLKIKNRSNFSKNTDHDKKLYRKIDNILKNNQQNQNWLKNKTHVLDKIKAVSELWRGTIWNKDFKTSLKNH